MKTKTHNPPKTTHTWTLMSGKIELDRVQAPTKSEARAMFKDRLELRRVPVHVTVVRG